MEQNKGAFAQGQTPDDLLAAIFLAFASVRVFGIVGWFPACGYSG
jgi:hypothetical protein